MRIALLPGGLPVLASAAMQSVIAFFHGVWLFVLSIPLLLLLAVIVWSFTHDQRLRERVAREGCPFTGDDGIGREREMRERYCR